MENTRTLHLVTFLNILDLLGISFALFLAFLLQFFFKELPCPLCLLQRVGLLAISFGFLLNVRFSVKASHYALSLLAAVFTGAVALRQVLLHIVPGSGSYGLPFLGLHLYTWMFVIAIATVIYTALMLCIPEQYSAIYEEKNRPAWLKKLAYFACFFLLAMTIANMVSVFMECGFVACPDSPVSYKL